MIAEIAYVTPSSIYQQLSPLIQADLLASAQLNQNRFSFIGIDAFSKITSQGQQTFINNKPVTGLPLAVLKKLLTQYSYTHAGLDISIPFQGGGIGFFSYDLATTLENIPATKNELVFPSMAVNFYDLIIAIDQQTQRAFIISNGLPATEKTAQQQRARQRLQWLQNLLVKSQKAPNYQWPRLTVHCNMSKPVYLTAVKKIIDYIYAGDIFQANFSQRFCVHTPADFNYWQLYLHLAAINPAPFLSYIHAGNTYLIASSPERFLRINNRRVTTQPIKGTCRRDSNSVIEQQLKQQLLYSEKNRAENIMIVDLMRNDLAKVCRPSSVQVKQLCKLATFSQVHHLVSTIEGEMLENMHSIDVLQACFPGGSITGAPKIRAMEIIAELEPTPRGLYCGCFGYLDFNGNLDLAMTIRSFVAKDHRLTWQAGGAIVADSEPESEYEESLIKAGALHQVLMGTT